LPTLKYQYPLLKSKQNLCGVSKSCLLLPNVSKRYQSANQRVEGLAPSLLAKAFRGELVEQDAEDESAEK
jgi:type I restriction enzyme, S subunit